MRQGLFLDLFRRHVGGRPHTGHLCRLLVFQKSRTEVGYFDVALAAQQDVRRLDVAVDHPLILGVFQRFAALVDNFRDTPERQQVIDFGKSFQRLSLDIFHHHVIHLPLHYGIEYLDDVRMGEFAGQRGLGQ